MYGIFNMKMFGYYITLMFAVLGIAPILILEAVTCPSGDTAGIIKDGKTCPQLVADDNAECYDTGFEASCCASCNNIARADQNCLYGDSATCFTILCSSYSDINTCCETCSSFITTQSPAQTTSTASTSTSSHTASISGTSDGQSTMKSDSSNNGGMIAGAVVGSIVGLTLIVVGAFIAFKMIKQKDKQTEDDTSSGVPEKFDRNSGDIPKNVDICTVLQEQLDTGSDLTEKHPVVESHTKIDAHNYENKISESKTNNNNENAIKVKYINNSDDHHEITNSKTRKSTINGENLTANIDVGHTDLKYNVNNDDHEEVRRQSLPPLKQRNIEATPIHDVLPPIGT